MGGMSKTAVDAGDAAIWWPSSSPLETRAAPSAHQPPRLARPAHQLGGRHSVLGQGKGPYSSWRDTGTLPERVAQRGSSTGDDGGTIGRPTDVDARGQPRGRLVAGLSLPLEIPGLALPYKGNGTSAETGTGHAGTIAG